MLEFDKTYVLISAVSPRGDKHGNERIPGLTVAFCLMAPNTILDTIEKGLKEMLYSKKPVKSGMNNGNSQGEIDLADTPLPYKRTDLIDKIPLVFNQEAYHATFFGKNKQGDLKLDGLTLKELVIEPVDGGSVKIYGKLILKNVNEKTSGRLGVLVQQHTNMTLIQPTEQELEDLEFNDD